MHSARVAAQQAAAELSEANSLGKGQQPRAGSPLPPPPPAPGRAAAGGPGAGGHPRPSSTHRDPPPRSSIPPYPPRGQPHRLPDMPNPLQGQTSLPKNHHSRHTTERGKNGKSHTLACLRVLCPQEAADRGLPPPTTLMCAPHHQHRVTRLDQHLGFAGPACL